MDGNTNDVGDSIIKMMEATVYCWIGKELHHVEAYEIKSSTFAGKRELSLKMLVTFPVVTDEKPEEPSGKTIKTTKQIADEIFEYLKKERLTANKAWNAISEVRRQTS